jgi:hypothetical protein
MSDQLQVLEELIPQIPHARLSEQFGEALQDAGTQALGLLPELARLESWKQSVYLLSDCWQGDEEIETRDELQKLRYAGQQCEAASDKEQLYAARALLVDSKRRIGIVLRDGIRAWQRRIEADIGSLGSLGGLLAEFGDTRTLGGRMTMIASRGAGLKSQFPPTASQVEDYRVMIEDAHSVRRDLAEIGAGASVEKFLLALATETATLDLVDQDVLQWIRDRRSDHRFHLALLRTGSR